MTSLHGEPDALRTLSEVVAWCLAAQPPAEITGVIQQDEFTLNVVVSAGPRWLVFDTT
ncbi:MAG: hypothetical protein U0325_23975 [Polyangiales bacterium]